MVPDQAAQRFLDAPLLADVDRESRQALVNVMVESSARAGAVLLAQGQRDDHLSILIEGTATIERTFLDGRKELLANLTAPALFGTTTFFRPAAPSVTVRATSDVRLLTLDHPAHERLRRDNPRAAEALSIAVVRVLAERFDLLDKRVTAFMAEHADDHPKVTEWANFRNRLFDDNP